MQFKFTPEGQKLFDELIALPEIAVDLETVNKPVEITRAHRLAFQRNYATTQKYDQRLRREFSFFVDLMLDIKRKTITERTSEMALCKAKGRPTPDYPNTTPQEAHARTIRALQAIKSGQFLRDRENVKIALQYGVVHLSDQELDLLLTYSNK